MDKQVITGIVGGVGPYAGLDLLGKILRHTAADRDQDHLPLVHLSLPGEIADRSAFLLGQTRVSPAGAIARQAAMAARLGATLIAVPCNTAHHPAIFREVAAGVERLGKGVRLVNMILEVRAHLAGRRPGAMKIGLLATRGTCETGIYEGWFAGSGLETVKPAADLQAEIHAAIYDRVYGIKATGGLTARAAGVIARAMEHLAGRGAEGVLLACTELSLVEADIPPFRLPVFDANTILARAIIRHAAPEKLRPASPEAA